jgi:hypothetical protein
MNIFDYFPKQGMDIGYFQEYIVFIQQQYLTVLDDTESTQIHHIIPRTLFKRGLVPSELQRDCDKNLIVLSVYNHLKAHCILALAFPNDVYLFSAVEFMRGKFHDLPTPEEFYDVYNNSFEYRSQLSKNNWKNEEYRKKQISIRSDPSYKQKLSEAIKAAKTPEMNAYNAEKSRQQWQDPEMRKQNVFITGEVWNYPGYRELKTRQVKDQWQNPAIRMKMRQGISTSNLEYAKKKRQEKEAAVMAETMGFLF